MTDAASLLADLRATTSRDDADRYRAALAAAADAAEHAAYAALTGAGEPS